MRVLFLALFAAVRAAGAQDSLPELRIGDRVRLSVAESSPARLVGTLLAITETAVSLRHEGTGQRLTIPRATLRAAERSEPVPRLGLRVLRDVGIGAAIGVVSGLGLHRRLPTPAIAPGMPAWQTVAPTPNLMPYTATLGALLGLGFAAVAEPIERWIPARLP